MGTTRRRALIATLGLAALPGCGTSDLAGPSEAVSTETTSRDSDPTESPNPTSRVPTPDDGPVPADAPESPTEQYSDHAADVVVYERDGQFSVVANGEVIDTQTDDLGRVINQAQATLSSGHLLVAADGSSRTAIAHEDNVVIGGLGRRTALTPAEDVGRPFDMYRTSGGPTGARLASVHIQMANRGRTAIRATGFDDVVFDGLLVSNAVKNGLTLAEGQTAMVRNCRFRNCGADATRLEGVSDVAIHDCTSIGAKYGIHARDSSGVEVRGYRALDTRLNGVAIYDYTDDWAVIDCRAVGNGHTPFSASPALDGSFIGCIAIGTTADREGGFEIEYKAGHDPGDRQAPVEGCSVVSCTAVECNTGFYAREDDSEVTTNTSVIRPNFIDCTAIRCETGLFIDENVVEAIIRGFDPVECTTDIVDQGTRTVIDGRSDNAGDPAVEGQWNGHAKTAAELGVTIEDTVTETNYTATETGHWEQVS